MPIFFCHLANIGKHGNLNGKDFTPSGRHPQVCFDKVKKDLQCCLLIFCFWLFMIKENKECKETKSFIMTSVMFLFQLPPSVPLT